MSQDLEAEVFEAPLRRAEHHVVVTRSQHIPRIQEAQASAYHALRELVES